MKKGRYLNKPKLLSETIDELLNEVNNLEPKRVNNGCPDSFYTKKPQQYQEYYHMICPDNNYYEAYYANSVSNGQKNDVKTKQSSPPKSDAKPQQKQSKKQQKKQQKNANKKQKGGRQPQVKDEDMPAIGRCIFVVGKIVEISEHNNADSMYVEMIDVGEDKPRQICSGIKNKVTMDEMLDSYVIVFTNLKKAKLRGIESCGMILAAKNADESKLQIVRPPKGTPIGERIVLEDEDLSKYEPTKDVKPKKKNSPWLEIKPDLKTNDEGIACYQGRRMMTSKGPLAASSFLANAQIS